MGKNMDVLIQSVAKTLDHPKDKLVIELLQAVQVRRRLEASAEAFSLRIIMLLTKALQSEIQQKLEEPIERIQQKLLGTSNSSGSSGGSEGWRAAVISELLDQGKAVPVWLHSVTVEQTSPLVFSEEITYTLPAGASTSTTNFLEPSSSVRTIVFVVPWLLFIFLWLL